MEKYLVYLTEAQYVNDSEVFVIYSDMDTESLQEFLNKETYPSGDIIAFGDFTINSDMKSITITKEAYDNYLNELKQYKLDEANYNKKYFKFIEFETTKINELKNKLKELKLEIDSQIYKRFKVEEFSSLPKEVLIELDKKYSKIKNKNNNIRYVLNSEDKLKLENEFSNKETEILKELDELNKEKRIKIDIFKSSNSRPIPVEKLI